MLTNGGKELNKKCGEQDKDSVQWHCKPIERDVAQLGSTFVLVLNVIGSNPTSEVEHENNYW